MGALVAGPVAAPGVVDPAAGVGVVVDLAAAVVMGAGGAGELA
jgi:hypothetical protein